MPGIITSLVLLTAITTFTFYEFNLMIFKLNPVISQLVMMRDLSVEHDSFKPYINEFSDDHGGFDFAINFHGMNDIDPTVGVL